MCPPGTDQRGRGGNIPPVVLFGCAAIAAPIACPLLICAAPVIGAYKATKRVKKSEWYRKRQRKKECQPPKPEKRKRRLSVSEDSGLVDERSKMVTENQLQSLLFKLPYELRRLIYEEVVGDLAVHVTKMDDKLCAYPCTDAHKLIRQRCWLKPARLSLTGKAVRPGIPFQFHDPGIGMMGLLMSCRRIYTEFVGVLYCEPTFIFESYRSMLSFCASILPERFNKITSVHFDNTTINIQPHIRQLYNQGSYLDLRKIATRNNRLSVLPVEDTKYGAWNHILALFKEMKSLKHLMLDLDFITLRPHGDNTSLPQSMSMLEDMNLSLLQVRIHWDWRSTPLDTVKCIGRELPFIETVRDEYITGTC
ncbi:hypothetical protein BDV96DRAFT_225827 [Lophiotrema nucula]|uniref:DUF7730 domain-containing protein n=1 Tax=Lophiotrema nucula TaxID=690887 RepID=A0A6A5YRL5_9PLEO|nr:hypothetical protein BDV96DRAFT_225827 [Lophiotrema nucula]